MNVDLTVGMEHRERGERKCGFSLLELLCAMAILMIIVLMISTIFAESDKTWTLGTNRADNNATGRAAVNMIANDLQYAVADNVLAFKMQPDRNNLQSFGFANSEICFVSLQNDCNTNTKPSTRTALEMAYYVDATTNNVAPYGQRYELKRAYWDSALVTDPTRHCYGGGTNGPNKWFDLAGRPSTNTGVLAQNVTGLGFYCPDGSSTYDSTANNNQLPQFVDIWLEILNDRPAAQVGQLWSVDNAQALRILQRNIRRYTARVYFHDRYGYLQR
jgi:type II secretory pathway pseudopilin PulG